MTPSVLLILSPAFSESEQAIPVLARAQAGRKKRFVIKVDKRREHNTTTQPKPKTKSKSKPKRRKARQGKGRQGKARQGKARHILKR
jgi:hypothetical protein